LARLRVHRPFGAAYLPVVESCITIGMSSFRAEPQLSQHVARLILNSGKNRHESVQNRNKSGYTTDRCTSCNQ
jgi:hypothetical protein